VRHAARRRAIDEHLDGLAVHALSPARRAGDHRVLVFLETERVPSVSIRRRESLDAHAVGFQIYGVGGSAADGDLNFDRAVGVRDRAGRGDHDAE
jgi:hypothetical protein